MVEPNRPSPWPREPHQSDTPRVVVATPFPTEYGIDGHFDMSLAMTMNLDFAGRGFIQGRRIILPSGPSLDITRNTASELFLASNHDFLLFLDSDMHWSPGDLIDFLDRNTRIPSRVTCGVYLVVHNDRQNPCMYGTDGEPIEEWTPGDCLLVAGAGTGAMLIPRGVLEEIHAQHGPEWFSTPGRGMNEDFAFCARLHQAGVPLVVDTGFEVGHRKKVTYTVEQWRNEREMRRAYEARQAAATHNEPALD